MKYVRHPVTVLLLLQAVVFVVYERILGAPIWSAGDIDILHDAFVLAGDPGVLTRHIGGLFSQPLLQVGFLVEFHLFGADPTGYMAVNLLLHGLNSFVVYLLANMLFYRWRLALPAALFFALSVGHYGKILLTISGAEPLLMGLLYLSVLFCLIRNDLHHGGRLGGPWYLLGLALFLLAGLAGNASFALVGCLLAYKFFFFQERGRRGILSPDLLILIALQVLFALAQSQWGWRERPIEFSQDVGAISYTWMSFKNIFRYLNLLVFPMQRSSLVQSGHPLVHFFYEWRVPIRVLISLGIVSFGFFGTVFGNRPVRFFIAWTLITILPFTGTASSGEWLNIGNLYLASVGFCVILAGLAVGAGNLLGGHRWRRLAPWLVPAAFVLMAQVVNVRLDGQNREAARDPEIIQLRQDLERTILTPRAWR